MTLVITMIRPEGIWQSSDNRVTRGGRPVDDAAAKQLHIKCFQAAGTPHMFLAFTGLAELEDGTPTLQWIRETLRGEARDVMSTLNYLRERLTRDVGRSRLWQNELVLSIGVFEGPKRFYAEVRNVRPADRKPLKEFDFVVKEITDPDVAISGSGLEGVSKSDWTLLVRQARIRPAKWEDHLGLLAAVNRRTAKRVKTVSPWCEAGYVSVDSETAHGQTFAEPGEPQALTGLHMIMAGIDAYEMTARLVKRMRQRMSGQPVSDQTPHGAGERAIKPRP
jgi:hypothetical protein